MIQSRLFFVWEKSKQRFLLLIGIQNLKIEVKISSSLDRIVLTETKGKFIRIWTGENLFKYGLLIFRDMDKLDSLMNKS